MKKPYKPVVLKGMMPDYLHEKGFSLRLCQLVQSHVQVKRYFTATYPAYYAKLSDASKQTLVHQGGRMTEEEMVAFESHPDHSLFSRLRERDDKATEKEAVMPALEKYRQMAVRHLVAQEA